MDAQDIRAGGALEPGFSGSAPRLADQESEAQRKEAPLARVLCHLLPAAPPAASAPPGLVNAGGSPRERGEGRQPGEFKCQAV